MQAKTLHRAFVPCKQCGRVFKVNITDEILQDVQKFPFPVVLMHISNDDKKEVHTLIAYIDDNLHCRHVENLIGKRVFITPYILYNPSLMMLRCNKVVSGDND